MLSLPSPYPPPTPPPEPPDWLDIEARMSRAIMHLHAALADITPVASRYGDQFGYMARPCGIERHAKNAWGSAVVLRDHARGRLRELQRKTDRNASTPLWLVGKQLDELDTMRLYDRSSHPPERAVQRAPHQTGRMRIFEEPRP